MPPSDTPSFAPVPPSRRHQLPFIPQAVVLAALAATPAGATMPASIGTPVQEFCLADLTAKTTTPTAPTMRPPACPAVNDSSKRSHWPNGATLHVVFLDSKDEEIELREFVETTAREWTQYANLKLIFHKSTAAFQREFPASVPEIRIQLDPSTKGNASDIGTDACSTRSDAPTMLISSLRAWLQSKKEEDRKKARRTVLHEFGHALGRRHEHQTTVARFEWNHDKVIADCKAMKWNEKMCWDNILTPLQTADSFDGLYDAASIMNYAIPQEWTIDARQLPEPLELSSLDKTRAAAIYPVDPRPPASPPTPPVDAPVDDKLTWTKVVNPMPADAAWAGVFDGRRVYLCRADGLNGQRMLGMAEDGHACNGPYERRRDGLGTFQVLVDSSHVLQWQLAIQGGVPADALKASVKGDALSTICRIRIGDNDVLGILDEGQCMVPDGAHERRWAHFEVLASVRKDLPILSWSRPEAAAMGERGSQHQACRTFFREELRFGWVDEKAHLCQVPFLKLGAPSYQVLVGVLGAAWVNASASSLPDDIVDSSPTGAQQLQLCRVRVGDQRFFGKLVPKTDDNRIPLPGTIAECEYYKSATEDSVADKFEILAANPFPEAQTPQSGVDHWIELALNERAPDEPVLCRAPYGTDLVPGWVDKGVCRHVAHGAGDTAHGTVVQSETFQVLQSTPGYSWVPFSSNASANALRVGRSSDSEHVVCKASPRKAALIGAVYGDKCHVASDSMWWSSETFEVAVRMP